MGPMGVDKNYQSHFSRNSKGHFQFNKYVNRGSHSRTYWN